MNIELGIGGSKSVYKKENDLTLNNSDVDVEHENYFLDNETTKNIDLSQLQNSDNFVKIEAKEDRALGFLWKKGTYTFTTSSGVKITVENIDEDTQVLEDKQTGEIVIVGANNAVVHGKSEKSKISIYNSTINELNADSNDDISVKNNSYQSLNINVDDISEVKSDALISIDENGNTIAVDEYFKQILSQDVCFETKEEYQQYVLTTLTKNLQSMKEMFEQQENNNGIISDGYDALKELTGLGISSKDAEEILLKQTEIVEGLTKALNNESDMSFEEAYQYYFNCEFSTEKIDSYIKLSNIYQASLVASNYDPEYFEKIEEKTGLSLENIAQDYYLAQADVLGEDKIYSELVEKYSADQQNFSAKLSNTISVAGLGCTVAGAVACIIPGGAAVGLPLMAAGRYISLGGMFVNNVIDLADNITDSDGLTADEVKDLALETGVEAVSFVSGYKIGGITSGINDTITNKVLQMGANKVVSNVIGQAAETGTDTLLSLGADYVIAQSESLIATGQLIDCEDYWSIDRFLGEGKNQLIAILTGLANVKAKEYSTKISPQTEQKTQFDGIDEIEALKNAEIELDSEENSALEQCVKQADMANSDESRTVEIPDVMAGKQDNDLSEKYLMDDNSNFSKTDVDLEGVVSAEQKTEIKDDDVNTGKNSQDNATLEIPSKTSADINPEYFKRMQEFDKYNLSANIKESIVKLDDTNYQKILNIFDSLSNLECFDEAQYQEAVRLFDVMFQYVDVEQLDISKSFPIKNGIMIKLANGKNIFCKLENDRPKVSCLIDGETTEIKCASDSNNIRIDTKYKPRVYDEKNRLIEEKTYTQADGLVKVISYDYENGIKTTHDMISGIVTEQKIDSNINPVGGETITEINLPKQGEDVKKHVLVPYQLNDGKIFGGHCLEDYTKLKNGDTVEFTLQKDNSTVTADVEVDENGNITFTYKLDGKDCKLQLKKSSVTDSMIQYVELNGEADFKLGYKTVVKNSEYNKMFEQLSNNEIANFFYDGKCAYFYTISDFGEKIFWCYPNTATTLFPVDESALTLDARNFYHLNDIIE